MRKIFINKMILEQVFQNRILILKMFLILGGWGWGDNTIMNLCEKMLYIFATNNPHQFCLKKFLKGNKLNNM